MVFGNIIKVLMKSEANNNFYRTSIRLKVVELKNENFRLEHLIVAKKLEIKKLEGKLNLIRKSKTFRFWQLYCTIRDIFQKNGKRR